MKVSEIIKKLQDNYSSETELMITWWGGENFEQSPEVWQKAVEIFDSENNRYQMSDYIQDVITDAEIYFEKKQEEAERAELAIDTYLHDLAEKELENGNV
jgi:hypothetical protein